MSGAKPRKRRGNGGPEPVSTPAGGGLGDGTGSYPSDLPTLYTVRQIAHHLNVSRSTIRRMVQLGQIPSTRVGGQLRFDVLAVRSRLDKAT